MLWSSRRNGHIALAESEQLLKSCHFTIQRIKRVQSLTFCIGCSRSSGRTEEGRYMSMKARDLSDICKVSPVDEVLIQGSYNY